MRMGFAAVIVGVFVLGLIGCERAASPSPVTPTVRAIEAASKAAENAIASGQSFADAELAGVRAAESAPGFGTLSPADREQVRIAAKDSSNIAAQQRVATETQRSRADGAEADRSRLLMLVIVLIAVAVLAGIIAKNVLEGLNNRVARAKEAAANEQRAKHEAVEAALRAEESRRLAAAENETLKEKVEEFEETPVRTRPTEAELANLERAAQIHWCWNTADKCSWAARNPLKPLEDGEKQELYAKKNQQLSKLFELRAVRIVRDDGTCAHADEGELVAELDETPWQTDPGRHWKGAYANPIRRRFGKIVRGSAQNRLHFKDTTVFSAEGRRVAEALLKERLHDSLAAITLDSATPNDSEATVLA